MINAICGLPRSGSTMLCNILNENEKFHASSTSILLQLINSLGAVWSNSIEFRAELKNRAKAEDKIVRVARGVCVQWYMEQLQNNKIVFDKCRGWNSNILMLRTIFPKSKAIVIVRDLRNVFASIEKQHRKNGLLDEANNPSMRQIENRANNMFSPSGIIGGPLSGIRDIITRQLPVFFIRYEDLILHPEEVIKLVYQYLEEDVFTHNLDQIKNTATDPDWLYLYKYPHVGAGKLNREQSANEWENYFSKAFADRIVQNNKWFFEHFGYV